MCAGSARLALSPSVSGAACLSRRCWSRSCCSFSVISESLKVPENFGDVHPEWGAVNEASRVGAWPPADWPGRPPALGARQGYLLLQPQGIDGVISAVKVYALLLVMSLPAAGFV